MATLTGQLQAQAAAAAGQVQAALGDSGASIVSALSGAGGLSEAVTALRQAGDGLAGLGANPQGFFDLIAHGNVVGMLGADVPAAMSLARAAAPVDSATLLAETQARVESAVQAAIGGTMAPEAVAAAIADQTAAIRGVVDGSASALQIGQAAAPLLAIASSVAGALAVPSAASASPFQGVLGSLVQPEARRAMDAAVSASLGAGAKAHDGVAEPLPALRRLLKAIRGEA